MEPTSTPEPGLRSKPACPRRAYSERRFRTGSLTHQLTAAATGRAGPKAQLRKVLGVPALTFYGVGLILGAGIYTLIGAAAGIAGNGLWLAFLVAAAVALLTALSYAELSSMFPRTAAEFEY